MFANTFIASPGTRMVRDEYEPLGNYYTVRQGGKYYYFPVRVQKHPPNAPTPILRFEKLPPVLMEGWVMTQGRIYSVSVQDLLRGIVRTSNEYVFEKQNGSKAKMSQVDRSAPDARGVGESVSEASEAKSQFSNRGGVSTNTPAVPNILDLLEPGVSTDVAVEANRAFDRLVQGQIESLHDSDDSEEER